MQNKRRLVGAAAGCAVAVATLLGAPAASAQDVCISCDPGHTPPAFIKTEAPGAPERAFHKIKAPERAFSKIPGGENYPGRTGDVFDKE